MIEICAFVKSAYLSVWFGWHVASLTVAGNIWLLRAEVPFMVAV